MSLLLPKRFGCLLALGLGLTAAAALRASDVTVSSTTYSSTTTVTATGSITTSGTVTANSGSNVTFQAGVLVHLVAGFTASSGSYFHAVLVDGVAPDTPTGLFATSTGTTSFTLTWSIPYDYFGVTGYEVKRDSTSLGTTSSPSLSVTGLTAASAYSMTVRAQDAAGNWSAWSAPLVVTADPTGNADGDTLTNEQETLLGTDPHTTTSDTGNATLKLKVNTPR